MQKCIIVDNIHLCIFFILWIITFLIFPETQHKILFLSYKLAELLYFSEHIPLGGSSLCCIFCRFFSYSLSSIFGSILCCHFCQLLSCLYLFDMLLCLVGMNLGFLLGVNDYWLVIRFFYLQCSHFLSTSITQKWVKK